MIQNPEPCPDRRRVLAAWARNLGRPRDGGFFGGIAASERRGEGFSPLWDLRHLLRLCRAGRVSAGPGRQTRPQSREVLTMTPDNPNRRRFVLHSLRATGVLACLAWVDTWSAGKPASKNWSGKSIPPAAIACGNCATQCVLDESAVKCVHNFGMCGYCNLCTGYFEPNASSLPPARKTSFAPTGAIIRQGVEDPYYEYRIDEPLCIGCGKCVKGCNRVWQRLPPTPGTARPLRELQPMFHCPGLPFASFRAPARS